MLKNIYIKNIIFKEKQCKNRIYTNNKKHYFILTKRGRRRMRHGAVLSNNKKENVKMNFCTILINF